jgi:branched-chain amino acid transport system substrate-binding protein
MLRIRQSDADAVLLVVFPKVASVFIRDAAKLGYEPLMVGSTALGNLDDIRGQVGMGDGPMQNVFALNHVAYSQNDPEMAEWKEKYKKYYPDKEFTIYNVMGIPAGMVIVEALKRAGPDLTRQRFMEIMNTLSGFQTGVYAGPISCSETDHQCNKSPAVVGLENGKLVNKGTVTAD